MAHARNRVKNTVVGDLTANRSEALRGPAPDGAPPAYTQVAAGFSGANTAQGRRSVSSSARTSSDNAHSARYSGWSMARVTGPAANRSTWTGSRPNRT